MDGGISPKHTTKMLIKTQVSMCEGFVSSANDRNIRAGDCEGASGTSSIHESLRLPIIALRYDQKNKKKNQFKSQPRNWKRSLLPLEIKPFADTLRTEGLDEKRQK